MTDWSALHCYEGATATISEHGALELQTPSGAGMYAAVLPIPAAAQSDPGKIGIRFVMSVEVLAGSVGIFASRMVDLDPLGHEAVCRASKERITVRVDGDASTERVCIRSGPAGSGCVRIHSVKVFVRKRFDITAAIGELLPVMLRSPGPVALTAIAAALTRSLGHDVDADEIGELTCAQVPVSSPLDRLWTGEHGRLAADVTRELIDLLPTYDASKMNPRHGYRGREQSSAYLRQSTIRVWQLLEEFESRGISGGTLLEVGSLFGQFSLCFQRMGFEVTCIDRYRAYDGALAGHVSHLRASGVTVIEADRDDEQSLIESLGRFDAVLAMAVVEHVPHTPREFLSTLGSHVAPGGVIALDTPNLARYWNRRRLSTGLTVFQGIDDQFYSEIPFEGHHREFTAAEMAWMVGELGAVDVRVRMFDYNLLQFAELWSDQLRALLTMTVDPMQADTVMVVGRIDQFRSPTP